MEQFHKDAKKCNELMHLAYMIMESDGIQNFEDLTVEQLVEEAENALDVDLANGWDFSHETPQAWSGECRQLRNFINKYKK